MPHFEENDPPDADSMDHVSISKTQKKREMHALQAIGSELVALSRDQLRRIALPESLRDAVEEAQRMSSFEAKRRQLQYIGKIMRTVEAEPIREALDALQGRSRAEVARQHHVESLRDRLLADEQATMAEIARQWPGADLQHLRVLRRNTLKERELGKPPRHFRELFRVLRELSQQEE